MTRSTTHPWGNAEALRIECEGRSVVAFDSSKTARCDDPAKLPLLLDVWASVPLVVWEIAPIARFAAETRVPFNIGGSLRVLLALMCEEIVEPETVDILLDRFKALWARAPLAVRTLHDIEVQVQTVLARQRYVSTHPSLIGTPFVEWRTLHAVDGCSPNFRMMALDPPLTTMRQPERATYFAAPRGDLWVDVHWPDLPWRMLAMLSRDTVLGGALHGGSMESALHISGLSPADSALVRAAVLRCNGYQPAYVHAVVPKAAGWTVDAAEDLCQHYLQAYKTAAQWLHVRAYEAPHGGTTLPPYSYLFTTRIRENVEETYRSAVTGIVQQSEAWLLRQAVLRWEYERERRAGREFLGAGSLIPIHDRLLYTLDRDVPIAPHVAVVQGLLYGIHYGWFPCEVRMGPSAGEFYRVDGSFYDLGQIALNLNLRDEHVQCPVCLKMGATQKILDRHMQEVHAS